MDDFRTYFQRHLSAASDEIEEIENYSAVMTLQVNMLWTLVLRNEYSRALAYFRDLYGKQKLEALLREGQPEEKVEELTT